MLQRYVLNSLLTIAACLAATLTLAAQGTTPPATQTAAPAKTSVTQNRKTVTAAVAPTPATPLNINTATGAQFETLPGIGPAVANRIVEYRQKNGAFKKVEELMNVKGIGEKSFLKIKALISVAASKTGDK